MEQPISEGCTITEWEVKNSYTQQVRVNTLTLDVTDLTDEEVDEILAQFKEVE